MIGQDVLPDLDREYPTAPLGAPLTGTCDICLHRRYLSKLTFERVGSATVILRCRPGHGCRRGAAVAQAQPQVALVEAPDGSVRLEEQSYTVEITPKGNPIRVDPQAERPGLLARLRERFV
jgi:hypothetical protein